jgi:2-oxoglutarate dehydrogenase E2 component (dihydrolipoamide succinyltransferase)
MSIEVTVPASGESVTTANVARWHKKNGDAVARGEVLVTLETDKVSNELEAAGDGILEILVSEGEEVAIGTLIARIQEEKAGGRASEPAAPKETPAATPAAPQEKPATPAASPAFAELKVPASGESITSATVASWRKNDGDTVVPGEVLVLLETDKVSNELEAPLAGTLSILVPEGEEVPVGTVIARIEAGAAGPVSTVAPPKPATTAVLKMETSDARRPPPQVQQPDAPVVREAPAAPVSDGRTTRRKMSMLRRKIATHLVNAQQTAAILTTFNEVDMSAVMDLRKAVQDEFVKKHGVKLGFMSFFVKAVTQALRDVPSINARIEGNDIIEHHFYDIGVAIGTDKGLVVPVLRGCDTKSFAQIEKDILDYANKAREGKITIEDLQGGVFSISNGGTYGSLLSTPILNPPQSGILGMHTIQQRPVALNGQVVIRPMMYLALSYDHRLVDGKEAVTFLIRIKDCLESPARLMLEM